jgi:hypothetical protein
MITGIGDVITLVIAGVLVLLLWEDGRASVPREAVERARALRDAMTPTSGPTPVLSWRRIARRLASEGRGEHHPGDLAYTVCDLD